MERVAISAMERVAIPATGVSDSRGSNPKGSISVDGHGLRNGPGGCFSAEEYCGGQRRDYRGEKEQM
jgi:hypothetical protein